VSNACTSARRSQNPGAGIQKPEEKRKKEKGKRKKEKPVARSPLGAGVVLWKAVAYSETETRDGHRFLTAAADKPGKPVTENG
jgi:hypothetical protein